MQSGPLSKDDFKVASRVLNRRFSRAESDIVFELFDLNRDGFISPENCRDVLGASYIKDLKAIIGRGGAVTFAPPPGYTLEKYSRHHLAGGRPSFPEEIEGKPTCMLVSGCIPRNLMFASISRLALSLVTK